MTPETINRPRMLMIAYSCDPHKSMEDRNGWYRAIQASAHFDVTVLCGPTLNEEELNAAIPPTIPASRLRFVCKPMDWLTQFCLDRELLFYIGYRRWMSALSRHARELEKNAPFAATHLASLCGYREPGSFWKMPGQFLWGPIGGTSGFPLSYLSIVDWRGGAFELARNAINACQLGLSMRIKKAAKKSSVVFSANSSTRDDLKRFVGVDSLLELETGIDFPIAPERELRPVDRPLRILWAGRIRAWKGLPLLIHAIAKVSPMHRVEVRVVGDGSCKRDCIRLAEKLKVNHCIEWLERPPYRDSLQHYRWADVFAFTSLRDTSGTGLLEALAMGAPIVGLDHQGARDIMSDDSCVRISVKSAQVSIDGFATAIERLAAAPELLKRLSDHALKRSQLYHWNDRTGPVEETYQMVAAKHLSGKDEVTPDSTSESIEVQPVFNKSW